MSFDLKVGATLTGGTTVTLTPAGNSPGKGVYAFPGHTRMVPQTAEMIVSTKGSKQAPIAHTGVKLTLGDHTVTEGCCTVNQGTMRFDTGVQYEIGSVSEAAVDAGIAKYRAFVYTAEFVTAVKAGLLPAI